MNPTRSITPGITDADRARLRQMQAYEDAVAYRSTRLAIPCPGCGPQRCDEHAVDVNLITACRRAAAGCGRAISASLAGIGPR
jgi:hypothetical protein